MRQNYETSYETRVRQDFKHLYIIDF